jgi:hypothetical protein
MFRLWHHFLREVAAAAVAAQYCLGLRLLVELCKRSLPSLAKLHWRKVAF